MIITDKEKDKLFETFKTYGGYTDNMLANMIFNDFIDRIEDYDKDDYLEDMVRDIAGVGTGSYNCSTYETAQVIAENIFDFNEVASEMQENGYEFDITKTEENLVKVLDYICQKSIISIGCDTLGELIDTL